MPEIHGCGDEAKKKAREEWFTSHRPGGTVTGKSSNTPLKPQTRSHLENKLQALLSLCAIRLTIIREYLWWTCGVSVLTLPHLQKKMDTLAHKSKKPTEKKQQQQTRGSGSGRGRGTGRANRPL